MDRQVLLCFVVASWALVAVVLVAYLVVRNLTLARNMVSSRRKSRRRKSPFRKKVRGVIETVAKAHWPKRKKRRKARRTPTPVALPLPRAKTSGWVIAFLIIALLIFLGGAVVAIMLLLPFFALFLVAPVSPEVQQQMNQAFAAVPHETVNEIGRLVLRFLISLLGGRLVG